MNPVLLTTADVIVRVRCSSAYGAALAAAEVPLLEIESVDPRTHRGVSTTAAVSTGSAAGARGAAGMDAAFLYVRIDDCASRIPLVAGSCLRAGDLGAEFLEELERTPLRQARLALQCAGCRPYEHSLALLTADRHPWFPGFRTELTTHVDPCHPFLLMRTREQAVDDPRKVIEDLLVRLVSLGLGPADPEISWVDSKRVAVQRIRPLDELVATTGSGGDCLDLALVFAAALEAATFDPVILLLGSIPTPSHALVAFWAQPGRRYRPVLPPDDICAALDRGDLVAFETTVITAGGEASRSAGTSAGFDPEGTLDAGFRRGANFAREELAFGLDVRATRPPLGRSHPYVSTFGDPVRRALEHAFRHASGNARIETLDLLRGALAVGGPVVAFLLAETGTARAALNQVLERASDPGDHSSRPVMTRSCRETLSAARRIARERGGPTVREGDLLWALLESPSRNVHRAFFEAGSEPAAMARALAQVTPRGGLDSASIRPQNDTQR